MSARNQKKAVSKLLKKAIKCFFKEDFQIVKECLDEIRSKGLDKKGKKQLEKVLLLFMMGELYGINTLHGILDSIGVKSNNYQKIWQKYSCQQILNLSYDVFSKVLENRLVELCTKTGSTWSRSRMTIIMDGSIFKQWLEQEPFGKYYATHFSGQTHKVEYGFNLLLIGVAIGDDFFPLFFHILCKGKGEKVKGISCKLLTKCDLYLSTIAKRHKLTYGKIYVSVDSGFRYEALIKHCENKGWEAIIACDKSHIFKVGDWKGKLRDYIEQTYKAAEKVHQAKYAERGEQAPPFVLRVKAYYRAMGRDVILVFFRINNSKKVSVVFTTHLSAKAKTIRRRFFQRVKIEQFFRFVKHTLKIQQSTSKNFLGFLKKAALFFLKALFCQLFTKKTRKRSKKLKLLGFERIRRLITYNLDNKPLEELISNGTFCTDFSL